MTVSKQCMELKWVARPSVHNWAAECMSGMNLARNFTKHSNLTGHRLGLRLVEDETWGRKTTMEHYNRNLYMLLRSRNRKTTAWPWTSRQKLPTCSVFIGVLTTTSLCCECAQGNRPGKPSTWCVLIKALCSDSAFLVPFQHVLLATVTIPVKTNAMSLIPI